MLYIEDPCCNAVLLIASLAAVYGLGSWRRLQPRLGTDAPAWVQSYRRQREIKEGFVPLIRLGKFAELVEYVAENPRRVHDVTPTGVPLLQFLLQCDGHDRHEVCRQLISMARARDVQPDPVLSVCADGPHEGQNLLHCAILNKDEGMVAWLLSQPHGAELRTGRVKGDFY